jgi:hypothetical protein
MRRQVLRGWKKGGVLASLAEEKELLPCGEPIPAIPQPNRTLPSR